jgi:hypothetical protein
VAFTQKALSFQFSPQSSSSGGTNLTFTGLRSEVKIVKVSAGGPGDSVPYMDGSIYGLTLSDMNSMNQIFVPQPTGYNKNSVTVQAGDAGGQPTTVFTGNVYHAWMDAQSMPDVSFRFSATSTGVEKYKPVPPTSVAGSTDVATLMGQLATTAGYQFENNGVNVKMSNPYLAGTIVTQIKTLARHAGIEHVIHLGKLAIWPPGMSRQGATTIISPDTIMVGYPVQIMVWGIIVRVLWSPTIDVGQKVTVQSSVTPASGPYTVFKEEDDLAAQMPHGPWFATLSLIKPGAQGVVVP